jgi:PAS domain S-box-containing protein
MNTGSSSPSESEAVLRSFFDSPGVMRGIVELVEGVIVHVSCNQAAARMYGIDRGSIAGKPATAAGASEDVAQKWVGLYEESRSTGTPVSMEYPRRDAEGQDRWLLATASYLGTGPSGNPQFGYTILDLTERKRAEKALRESEERFRAQVTASSDVVFRMNPDWSEMRQLRGRDFITDTEAPSHSWLQTYIHPDDQPRVLAAIDKAIRTKSTFELELQILRVDGTLGWTFSRAVPLQDANGDIVEWLGAASDITGRKLAEEALNKQRQLLEVTLQSIGDAVLATDAGGRVTFLNPVAAGLTGWAEQEALGRPARDVLRTIDELTRESGEDIVGRVLREARVVSMANHTVLLARDGREIPIEDSAAPIRDSAGNLLGVVLVFHDVTEKRRAQQALRASEWRLRTLSDNLPEGAIFRYSHDVQGQPHVDFISAGIEQLTGVPAAEFMADAATVYRNILPEDHDLLTAAIALSRERLEQFEVEVRHPHRVTGEIRWSLLRSTPTRNPDGSMIWDGIELDITERRRAEESLRENRAKLAERTIELERAAVELEERNREVERVNRMKTDFLSRMSHELRTPLNAIVGYSDLLSEQSAGPLPPPYPRFVANIQEGARHLLAMVNDLLDISRIEAGRIDLNREAFSPAGALEEVLSVIAPLARIKNVSIEDLIPDGLSIRADRIRFKQVLYNLFSNAVKFTPENGRVWIADASREDAAGFCVGDTGIGIPESELELVFDEFHQVGTAGAAKEGSGLGLSITRRLVELHGGTIGVESTLGQGSRFTFSLGAGSLA